MPAWPQFFTKIVLLLGNREAFLYNFVAIGALSGLFLPFLRGHKASCTFVRTKAAKVTWRPVLGAQIGRNSRFGLRIMAQCLGTDVETIRNYGKTKEKNVDQTLRG